jgi:hypothetical protein
MSHRKRIAVETKRGGNGWERKRREGSIEQTKSGSLNALQQPQASHGTSFSQRNSVLLYDSPKLTNRDGLHSFVNECIHSR